MGEGERMKWFWVDRNGNVQDADLPCDETIYIGQPCPQLGCSSVVTSINFDEWAFYCVHGLYRDDGAKSSRRHPLPDEFVVRDDDNGKPFILRRGAKR